MLFLPHASIAASNENSSVILLVAPNLLTENFGFSPFSAVKSDICESEPNTNTNFTPNSLKIMISCMTDLNTFDFLSLITFPGM